MPDNLMPDQKPVLSGQHVILRPPTESDKLDRLRYGRNEEFRRMVGGDHRTLPALTLDEVERWYSETVAAPYAWVLEYQGRCIGRVRLHSLDEANRRARYAIGICDPVSASPFVLRSSRCDPLPHAASNEPSWQGLRWRFCLSVGPHLPSESYGIIFEPQLTWYRLNLSAVLIFAVVLVFGRRRRWRGGPLPSDVT